MDLFYVKPENINCKISQKHALQHKMCLYIIEYAAKNFYNMGNSQIELNNKKPVFKFSGLNFSISHTNGIAAVCFDDNPIGFDIEEIKKRNFALISERMKFHLERNTLKYFYKCWTNYEAEYKLHGTPKSAYSFLMENKYMVSVVSGAEVNIKTALKIHKVPRKYDI